MKIKHLWIVAFFLGSQLTLAQNHFCSDAKIKRFNKSRSLNQRSAQSSSVAFQENNYDLKFYHLNINVERNTKFVSGNVKSIATVTSQALDTFAFVLHQNHTVDSVYINGTKQNFNRYDSLVLASTGATLAQNQLFEAIVYYHGTCPTGGGAAIGDGYNHDQSPSWGNEVTWSLSEADCAYHWFPCKQSLRDKIDSVWVFATTDSTNMVGSNGLLTNVVTIGNKKRYEWKSNYPIDYYLISVSTAKYKPYILYAKPAWLPNDSIMILNYIYDNAINNNIWVNSQKVTLNKIVPTFELQCNLFGMYPFKNEKYGHCMAPLGGGMEHQTMTTLGFFDFEIDAHELGHQWWGDHVTCSSWKDIFINEGWASYTEYLCHQYLGSISGTTASQKMQDVHNSVMSQPGGSSYISDADSANANVIFNSRLTYDKGSAILHSLRYEIDNDSVFFPAIRAFQNAYAYSTASVVQFKDFMANYSGINFDQFFNQWYYGEGYPTFSLVWNQINNVFFLKSSQTTSMPNSVPVFMTHVDYKIIRTGLPDTIIRLYHGQAIENYMLPIQGNITGISVDPNNWILNKIGTIVKDVTLNVTGHNSTELSIFIGPNPSSDILNISANLPESYSVEISDMNGKIVLNNSINKSKSFDISNWANGLYNIKVTDAHNNTVKSTKLLKN